MDVLRGDTLIGTHCKSQKYFYKEILNILNRYTTILPWANRFPTRSFVSFEVKGPWPTIIKYAVPLVYC